MRFFDEFDHEDQAKSADIEINLTEKATILAISGVAKMALRKAKRAKTYGDIYKIMNLIDLRMDSFDKKADETLDSDLSDEEKSKVTVELVNNLQSLETEIDEL